jgi:hypothetical protein
MTKLFKKIKKVDKSIDEKKNELSVTMDPLNGYYLLISNEEERKRDIQEINYELKILYCKKHSLLETLERDIHIEKVDISNIERKLTLTINH